jgi:Tol biopolymer transport system component
MKYKAVIIITLVLALLVTVVLPVSAAPKNERIAFVLDQDGNTNIYVMKTDGSHLVRLTDNPGGEYYSDPTWSPDGKEIAFVSFRDDNYEIYVMKANGKQLTRLTNNPGWDINPSWSPDGTKIAFESNRNTGNGIYIMDADGGNQTRISPGRGPAWSPDGTKILYWTLDDSSVFINQMNPDGTGKVFIYPFLDGIEDLTWSPDGRTFAFSGGQIGQSIYFVNYTTGGYTGSLPDGNETVDYTSPSWSPDGFQIVFTKGDGIYTWDFTGTQIYITDGSDPCWKP